MANVNRIINQAFVCGVLFLIAACTPATGMRYDMNWSTDIFRWDSPSFPKVKTVEVFYAAGDTGSERPYSSVRNMPKIIEIDRYPEVLEFLRILHSQQSTTDVPGDVPDKVFHIVLWSNDRKDSAYGRLLVFKKENGTQSVFLKAYDSGEHYMSNPLLLRYIENHSKIGNENHTRNGSEAGGAQLTYYGVNDNTKTHATARPMVPLPAWEAIATNQWKCDRPEADQRLQGDGNLVINKLLFFAVP